MILLTFELIKHTIIDNYTQKDTFENVSDSCLPLDVCPSLTAKPKILYFNVIFPCPSY